MRKILVIAFAVILTVAITTCALADPEPIGPFLGKAFSSMGTTSEVGSLVSSAYNFNNTFKGTISSSVWSLSTGDYLYMYQAKNDGPSALELVGLAPFYGVKEAGYITDGAPAGYLSGGKLPVQISGEYSVTYDTDGNNVSFGYLGFIKGGSVPAGQHTGVLYLVSADRPVMGTVYAMDSGVGYADGWTSAQPLPVQPVPEPSSLLALGLGVIPVLYRRRRSS